MAAFGAQYPCFAPFAGEESDSTMPKYKDGVVLGELISANLTVTASSGEMWGDDRIVESVEEFASGELPMETVDMDDEVASVVYGCTVKDGELHDKVTDEAPLGGLGYFKSLMRDGKKFYRCYFYPKVKAAVTNDNAQTKDSAVTFQPNTTNFTIFAPMYDGGSWRVRYTAETVAEAKEWVREKLGMEAEESDD